MLSIHSFQFPSWFGCAFFKQFVTAHELYMSCARNPSAASPITKGNRIRLASQASTRDLDADNLNRFEKIVILTGVLTGGGTPVPKYKSQAYLITSMT